MIEVTVRLLRASKGGAAEVLGVAQIANVGGTRTSGDYAVRLFGKGGRVWKQGTVEGFPRLRLGGWDLLFRALGGVIAGRNLKVPFPERWLEEDLSLFGGEPLATFEEDPQAGGPEDPRKTALIETLEAWVKCDPAARAEIIDGLRKGRRPSVSSGDISSLVEKAARVLETLGEAVS
jgi:hypothetical protein